MKNQIEYRERLYQLWKILEKASDSREYAKTAITQLTADAKTRSKEYIQESVTPVIENIKVQAKIFNNSLYAEVCEKLREIEALTEVDHTSLDLNKPEWTNALKLIEMAGSSISGDLVRQINASFAQDQPALKALEQIYAAKGVKYDGGLKDQISSPEHQFETLRDWAFASLVQDISLNSFAAAINKVTLLEGFEFGPINGEDTVLSAARKAAGLPPTETSSDEGE